MKPHYFTIKVNEEIPILFETSVSPEYESILDNPIKTAANVELRKRKRKRKRKRICIQEKEKGDPAMKRRKYVEIMDLSESSDENQLNDRYSSQESNENGDSITNTIIHSAGSSQESNENGESIVYGEVEDYFDYRFTLSAWRDQTIYSSLAKEMRMKKEGN